ncbi:MAG: hypothetical protein IKK34_09070 [Clostridia bacterium]|nr:hypothetical protein [Clostridia bacterium]
MKRLVTLMLMLLFMVGVASAEAIDLSGMSFDELVALREKVDLAIWSCEEWQEVKVPQGVWVIGQDIPAGKWTIKADDGITALLQWGDMLDEAGNGISWDGKICETEMLYSETCRFYEKGDATEVTWDLKDGQYFIVEEGIVQFSPYSGKPSLGFK